MHSTKRRSYWTAAFQAYNFNPLFVRKHTQEKPLSSVLWALPVSRQAPPSALALAQSTLPSTGLASGMTGS